MAGVIVSPTPQQSVTVLASGTYASPQVAAPVAIPVDHTDFVVTVDRTNLPNVASDVLHIRIDHWDGKNWSPNPSGELNWTHGPFPIEFTVAGGAVKNQNAALTTTTFLNAANVPLLGGCQLRITMMPLQSAQVAVKLATAKGAINMAAV